jgi:hypothetical protein
MANAGRFTVNCHEIMANRGRFHGDPPRDHDGTAAGERRLRRACPAQMLKEQRATFHPSGVCDEKLVDMQPVSGQNRFALQTNA